jgi:hypothetical protein
MAITKKVPVTVKLLDSDAETIAAILPKKYLWFFIAEYKDGQVVNKTSGSIMAEQPVTPDDISAMSALAIAATEMDRRRNFVIISWEKII